MNEEFNPYAAPRSVVLTAPVPDQELPLASRWHRFVAAFLEGLILMALFMPLQFLSGTFQREAERQAAGGSMFAFRPENMLWAAAGLLIMVGINWNFLLNGQTIGKKALGPLLELGIMDGLACLCANQAQPSSNTSEEQAAAQRRQKRARGDFMRWML
ncbi:MAG: RDD family protein [Prosthecobacter sp.]